MEGRRRVEPKARPSVGRHVMIEWQQPELVDRFTGGLIVIIIVILHGRCSPARRHAPGR